MVIFVGFRGIGSPGQWWATTVVEWDRWRMGIGGLVKGVGPQFCLSQFSGAGQVGWLYSLLWAPALITPSRFWSLLGIFFIFLSQSESPPTRGFCLCGRAVSWAFDGLDECQGPYGDSL